MCRREAEQGVVKRWRGAKEVEQSEWGELSSGRRETKTNPSVVYNWMASGPPRFAYAKSRKCSM